MASQEDALADLARALDQLSVPYMIIGGLANARWGVRELADLLERPEILSFWNSLRDA